MSTNTHLTTIGRFHAKEGCEAQLEAAIREAWPPAAAEEGCVSIVWYRAVRDPRLFFVHSVWKDDDAFEFHANTPGIEKFIPLVETLIDHPLDVTRMRPLE